VTDAILTHAFDGKVVVGPEVQRVVVVQNGSEPDLVQLDGAEDLLGERADGDARDAFWGLLSAGQRMIAGHSALLRERPPSWPSTAASEVHIGR
jgi:hypothetical protein